MHLTQEAMATAQSVLDYHELFPHQHDQSTWVGQYRPKVKTKDFNGVNVQVCDSTMCVAGTVAFLNKPYEEFKLMDGIAMSNFARTELGLSSMEASRLFLDSTDRQAMDVVKAIAAGDKDEAIAAMGRIY